MHSVPLRTLLVAAALAFAWGDVAKSQAIGGAASTGAAAAATPDKIPPGLEFYKGREIAQTMHYAGAPWLTRDSRDREEDCNKLLRELKLQPDSKE